MKNRLSSLEVEILNKYSLNIHSSDSHNDVFYIFILNFKKELLSDIMEYEVYLSNIINENPNFIFLKIYCWELDLFLNNKISNISLDRNFDKVSLISFFKSLNLKNKNEFYDAVKNMNTFSDWYTNISFSNKLNFFKTLNPIFIENIFPRIKHYYDESILKKNLLFIEFYNSFFSFLASLRNSLAHNDLILLNGISFDGNLSQNNDFKKNLIFLTNFTFKDYLLILDNCLLELHNNISFKERFKEKLNNNKLSFENKKFLEEKNYFNFFW